MDVYELTQIMVVVTSALVLGRLGLALARRIERRPTGPTAGADAERLQAVEEECGRLRREMSDLQERQDFTERLLSRGGTVEARIQTPR